MKRFLPFLFLLISICAAAQTRFGALIITPDSTTGILEYKKNVARQLGVSHLRDAVVLNSPKKLNSLIDTSFGVILNIKWTDVKNCAVPFPTDTVRYKIVLDSFFQSLYDAGIRLPEVAVIENEACNANYYTGNAQEYINELQAATGVCHKWGIKVADAGTTAAANRFLLSREMTRAAKDSMIGRVGGITSRRAGEFADSVMRALRRIGVDFANFHWYQDTTDIRDLCNAIKHLRKTSGLPVMTNEIGQNYHTNPAVVRAMLSHIIKWHRLKYLLWYSEDSDKGVFATALHNNDGTLRDNGIAFRDEIKKFKP